MSELWQSFWWNAPIRTFTELYIEICLAFFLNVLNVSFVKSKFVDSVHECKWNNMNNHNVPCWSKQIFINPS